MQTHCKCFMVFKNINVLQLESSLLQNFGCGVSWSENYYKLVKLPYAYVGFTMSKKREFWILTQCNKKYKNYPNKSWSLGSCETYTKSLWKTEEEEDISCKWQELNGIAAFFKFDLIIPQVCFGFESHLQSFIFTHYQASRGSIRL